MVGGIKKPLNFVYNIDGYIYLPIDEFFKYISMPPLEDMGDGNINIGKILNINIGDKKSYIRRKGYNFG